MRPRTAPSTRCTPPIWRACRRKIPYSCLHRSLASLSRSERRTPMLAQACCNLTTSACANRLDAVGRYNGTTDSFLAASRARRPAARDGAGACARARRRPRAGFISVAPHEFLSVRLQAGKPGSPFAPKSLPLALAPGSPGQAAGCPPAPVNGSRQIPFTDGQASDLRDYAWFIRVMFPWAELNLA